MICHRPGYAEELCIFITLPRLNNCPYLEQRGYNSSLLTETMQGDKV